MDTTRLRAHMALMGIFRDLGIPVADALPVAEIETLWPEYGVRAGDLWWAIDELVRDGLLARDVATPDRLLLTRVGEQWLREQPAWLEYRLIVLRAARARCRRGEQDLALRPNLRRRRGESAATHDQAS